jgi:hypothetical protein
MMPEALLVRGDEPPFVSWLSAWTSKLCGDGCLAGRAVHAFRHIRPVLDAGWRRCRPNVNRLRFVASHLGCCPAVTATTRSRKGMRYEVSRPGYRYSDADWADFSANPAKEF